MPSKNQPVNVPVEKEAIVKIGDCKLVFTPRYTIRDVDALATAALDFINAIVEHTDADGTLTVADLGNLGMVLRDLAEQYQIPKSQEG